MFRGLNYPYRRRRTSLISISLCLVALVCATQSTATDRPTPEWSARFDSKVVFYQSTELGAMVVGTENSLYAIDSESGEVLWRRRNSRLDASDVAPVMGTDLLLINLEKDKRARLEAVDVLSGKPIWQSDKLKGSVMQMAVDLPNELIALVLVRDAKAHPKEGFRRRPTVHLLSLSSGEEFWRQELENVEMTPARWSDDENAETFFTLDNYRPPSFLDGRLYLFYEGVTSLDARSGKERIRERFRVNEDGLALTEADPVADEENVYVSGRGRVRAIARESGRTIWEARDLGLTPELMRTNRQLFVRTGGQFNRLKDGDVTNRGPYGVSALDPQTGRILWRYKGADKGITNLAMPDEQTVLIADNDELIAIDAATGKPKARIKHEVDRAAFVLINESRQAVVGGRSEIAAFEPSVNRSGRGDREIWRARYDAPGRGLLRTIGAITARSASLYFRYGGVATNAFRGVQIASSLSSLRWSSLVARAVLPNLTDYAMGAAREYVTSNLRFYGVAVRAYRGGSFVDGLRSRPRQVMVDVDIEERLMDRIDPAHQLDKLSRFLWRRERLSVVRGQHMYFYTDLKTGRGLAGVNMNTGATQRTIRLNEPDARLIVDEVLKLLYSAQGDRLFAHGIE